jgi:hypothetical protein
MLHAAALADIEDSAGTDVEDIAAFKYELIDVGGIDEVSLRTIRSCSAKVELIFQWIQQLITENIKTGVLSVPPPILSRSFQEIANGMVAFHDAMKISYIPFPFPYAQVCDTLLLLHWLLVPCMTSQWVTKVWWATIFGFVQVFVLWALNLIAVELENPFGMDANDLDCHHMQMETNEHLLLLLQSSTERTPSLSSAAADYRQADAWTPNYHLGKDISFCEVWCDLDGDGYLPARSFNCANIKIEEENIKHSANT